MSLLQQFLQSINPKKNPQRKLPVINGGRRGVRRDIPGIEFKSSWEANYYRYASRHLPNLLLLEYEPTDPEFLFPWTPENKTGIHRYIPDFKMVFKDLTEHYVEVKGCKNLQHLPEAAVKKAWLIKRYYPRIKLYFVTEKEYKKIERLYAHDIDEWEY